jgi:hypothetical protein
MPSYYRTLTIIFAILKIIFAIALLSILTFYITSLGSLYIPTGGFVLFYLLKTIHSTYEELSIINNFNKEWNLVTLLTIRNEFNSLDASSFLCIASPTFKALWNSSRHLIQYLASDFLETSDYDQYYYIGSSYLFGIRNIGVYLKTREVRLAFLNHEINRLTTNDKTI